MDHPHKYLVTEDNLKAGTGFDIKYPSIVKGASHQILQSEEKFE